MINWPRCMVPALHISYCIAYCWFVSCPCRLWHATVCPESPVRSFWQRPSTLCWATVCRKWSKQQSGQQWNSRCRSGWWLCWQQLQLGRFRTSKRVSLELWLSYSAVLRLQPGNAEGDISARKSTVTIQQPRLWRLWRRTRCSVHGCSGLEQPGL